jgi:hypothetical protein
MLKTISAALLAASIVAAPALAADSGKNVQSQGGNKTAQAPVNGSSGAGVSQSQTGKAAQVPAGTTATGKTKALNANAKMHRTHHRSHNTSSIKTHSKAKVSLKRLAPATKHG